MSYDYRFSIVYIYIYAANEIGYPVVIKGNTLNSILRSQSNHRHMQAKQRKNPTDPYASLRNRRNVQTQL